ncbi:Exosome complex component Rrp42 [Bienertia sinuspersici]
MSLQTMLAAIKMEIMTPSTESPDEGNLAVEFHMPPICSPLVRPGRPADAAPVISKQLADTISRQVTVADLGHKKRGGWGGVGYTLFGVPDISSITFTNILFLEGVEYLLNQYLVNTDHGNFPCGWGAIQLACSAGMINLKELCLVSGKAAWMAYLDICCLDADGSLFDAALLSAVAAFSNCKLLIIQVFTKGRKTKIANIAKAVWFTTKERNGINRKKDKERKPMPHRTLRDCGASERWNRLFRRWDLDFFGYMGGEWWRLVGSWWCLWWRSVGQRVVMDIQLLVKVVHIPVVSLNDEGRVFIVSEDMEEGRSRKEPVNKEKRRLTLSNVPFSLTCVLHKKYILADPTAEEESIIETSVTVVSNSLGQLVSLYKPGGPILAFAADCVALTRQRVQELQLILNEAVSEMEVD